MSRKAAQILLNPDERAIINEWARSRTMPLRVVQRAKIIQMASNGIDSQDIAKELNISRPTVQLWRQRFLALRTDGLEKDAPRPGAPYRENGSYHGPLYRYTGVHRILLDTECG